MSSEGNQAAFAGLTGQGLSYLSASTKTLPSFQRPPAFRSPPTLLLNHRLPTWHNPPPGTPSRPLVLLYPLNLSLARYALTPIPAQHLGRDLDSSVTTRLKPQRFHLPTPFWPETPTSSTHLKLYTFNYPSAQTKHSHSHPIRPNHYTCTFSFENPQGVDNYDNSIESIGYPDDRTSNFARDVKYPHI